MPYDATGYDYEDMVEMSVRVLDNSTDVPASLRSICYALYRYQSMWSPQIERSYLRVLDILIEHRYVYRMLMSDHPDFALHQGLLTRLAEESHQAGAEDALRMVPELSLFEKDVARGGTAGFYLHPYLYADVGSPLWSRLVEAGNLSRADKKSPDDVPSIPEIAAMVVRCAEYQQQYEVMLLWYVLLPAYLVRERAKHPEVSAPLQSMTDIINRCDVLNRAKTKSTYQADLAAIMPAVTTAEDYLRAAIARER